MVNNRLNRFVRRHCRCVFVLAFGPLIILNGWPFAAGCICADGHYEPVCRASLCAAGTGDRGCPCCAHHVCCGGKTSCCRQHSAGARQEERATCGVRSKGCCTPVVHQPVPTVITSPQVIDAHQFSALATAVIELPSSIAISNIGHRIEFDTGPQPDDLVVMLQRLLI